MGQRRIIVIDTGEKNDPNSFKYTLFKTRERNPPKDSVSHDLITKVFNTIDSNFDERERQILRLRYIDGKTMKQVGEIVDLSESRISQVESALLPRLKKLLAKEPTIRPAKVAKVPKQYLLELRTKNQMDIGEDDRGPEVRGR